MDDPGLLLKGLAGLALSLSAVWALLDRFAKRIGQDTQLAIAESTSDTREEIENSKARILERVMPILDQLNEKIHRTDLIAQEARILATMAAEKKQEK
jgi:hypothetical protein